MYPADHGARQLRIKVVVIQDGVTRASYVTFCSFLLFISRKEGRRKTKNEINVTTDYLKHSN